MFKRKKKEKILRTKTVIRILDTRERKNGGEQHKSIYAMNTR